MPVGDHYGSASISVALVFLEIGCASRVPPKPPLSATNPVDLREAVHDRITRESAYVPLSSGLRGTMRDVHLRGIAEKRGHVDVEFTHVSFNDQGLGGRYQSELALVVGIVRPDSGEIEGYMLPTIHRTTIPSLDELSGVQDVKEFTTIFGDSRGIHTPWQLGNGLRYTRRFRAFSLNDDGSARVVFVVLDIELSDQTERILGTTIREGRFLNTNAPPRLTKRE